MKKHQNYSFGYIIEFEMNNTFVNFFLKKHNNLISIHFLNIIIELFRYQLTNTLF